MTDLRTLNDGNTLPAIGFGTYPMKDDEGVTGLVSAIEVGYRLDTDGTDSDQGASNDIERVRSTVLDTDVPSLRVVVYVPFSQASSSFPTMEHCWGAGSIQG